jgi:hypothetical protein
MPRSLETNQLVDILFKKHLNGFYIHAKQGVTTLEGLQGT